MNGSAVLDRLTVLESLTPEQWAAVEALMDDAYVRGREEGYDAPRPWAWYARLLPEFVRRLFTPLPWLFPAWLAPPPPPRASLQSALEREQELDDLAREIVGGTSLTWEELQAKLNRMRGRDNAL